MRVCVSCIGALCVCVRSSVSVCVGVSVLQCAVIPVYNTGSIMCCGVEKQVMGFCDGL